VEKRCQEPLFSWIAGRKRLLTPFPGTFPCCIRVVGPLGRRVNRTGRMNCLPAAARLPGRCPSLGERLGLRPACGSVSRADCVGLASPACPEVRAPKGRRFAQRRAPPWLRKTPAAPPFFHHPVFRPNGPTVIPRSQTPLPAPDTVPCLTLADRRSWSPCGRADYRGCRRRHACAE
jgi:hypothetical protein